MAQWVDTDSLKDALAKFRAKGDERWALKSEVPTDEHITEIVEDTVDDMESLTQEDLDEIFEAGGFTDSGGGGPN